MLLYYFIPFFAVLSAAAPVADDQASPRSLQKRLTNCNPHYGHAIALRDCVQVVQQMQRLPSHEIDTNNGWFKPLYGTFGRESANSLFRLPRVFSMGTCSILVDLPLPNQRVTTSWSLVATGALAIVNSCVRDEHVGGDDDRLGFHIIVSNEQNIDERLRPQWNQCKNYHSTDSLDLDALCLLHDLEQEATKSLLLHSSTLTSK